MNALQRMHRYWKEEFKGVLIKECYKGSVYLYNIQTFSSLLFKKRKMCEKK